MYPPDGLLTSGFPKHDVGHDPHIIAPDPFSSDGCLDVFSLVPPFPPPEPKELNTMNPSEDEPSSGLNGRLRPRRSTIPTPLSIKPIIRKLDNKLVQEKQKRSNTPSKASPSKPEDQSDKPILLPTPHLLCPYCDRKFGSKQNVSKHIRRMHISTSKCDTSIVCLYCNHVEIEVTDIIRHMIDSHPNQYFACLDCHTRFPSTKELAEHKLNICERQKIPYCSKLRRTTTKKRQKSFESNDKDTYVGKNFNGHGFNGIVISCELKPSHIHDDADIEDNITTNLILPPNKNLPSSAVLEKNAVIVLDDIQWNRKIPSNFSFHNYDADQILSRLGVVHKSPRTGDSTKKGWFRAIEDATQKFEKCFDTSFYSKVASNVQENLAKFLDGSFNFNPDPDNTIKTRKAKNSVVINTAEGFPILLACEQYSRNSFDSYLPRSMAPKHKWKWDSLETEKPWNPDQIKKDTHANNCIITLVSSLDIWTQLCMRRKFEDKFNITPVGKKVEKQNVIGKQLKDILESREIPSANSQIVKHLNTPLPIPYEQDFPTSLGLMPSAAKFNLKPAILSGEWVRPRCYVCCACGAQSRDSRTLSLHVSSHHPHAQVQHYEIVGESLLKADILKHLYVPPNQYVNRTRPTRGIKDCTKCNKSIVIEELHQHMLDCAGDTPAVRRKCRYRPFGVRRRRPRLPDNRIRKKMRNDIRTRPTRQKNRMRPKSKIRSDVGDAETIRKMLADLPAKRHRVLVNPLNSILRPRRKLDKQRAMLMLKRCTSEDPKSGKLQISNNTTHYDNLSNIDRYKGKSSKDDEDNKPLKSRLSRVASKILRQKESVNRKPILKRPKRNVSSLDDEKQTDDPEKETNDPEKETDGYENETDGYEKETDNPEKETDDPENEKNNPEKETKDTEKETDGYEKETDDPEKETDGYEKETDDPEKETDDPENAKNNPEKVTNDSEKKSDEPEKETDDPEKETDDPGEQNTKSDPVNIENNELSMDQNEKRIDLNSDPENIREHSDRGDNNNGQRDNEEPGPSRQNDNNAPEENDAPPCIPLKHSIARLTASSETHDKAVQFHQLFLIRQQCNANKHVPSGSKVFFENETVISRLDKPPLLYDKNIGIDPVQAHNEDLIKKHNSESTYDHDLNQHLDSTQKNKLNKPKKGLNDCIAMLKNKLVDTDTNAPAHVSVQCGTDDPLNPEPLHLSPASMITPRSDVPMKTLQTSPCIERPKKSSPKSIVRNEQVLRPSPLYRSQNYNYDFHGNINNERQIAQWRPINYVPVAPKFIDNRPRKETSRRRSSSQHENIYLAQQLLSMTPPHDDMLLKFSSEPYDTYNYLPRTSPKNYPEQFVHVVGNNNIYSRIGNHNVFDKSHAQASNGLPQNCGITVTNHNIDKNKRSLDTGKKNTKTRVSVPKKPVEHLDKNINIRKEKPKSTRYTSEKYPKKTIDCRPHSDFLTTNFEERKNESYPPLIPPLPTRKRSSHINTDTHLLPFKPVERQLTTDANLKMPLKVYSEHNFNTKQVAIPPAHASTNIQSILPVPLDLSGKALSVHPQYSSRREFVSCSYNRYETLDLSNKPRTTIEHQIVDEVVDLRVKHTPQYKALDTLKPPGVQQNLNSVPTLNLIHHDEMIPTDLSLKRKDEDSNKWINLSQKKKQDVTQIQDLSKHKFKTIPSENRLHLDKESPTDLSKRKITDIEVITSISKESNTDNKSENFSTCDVLNQARRSSCFSEKPNDEKHNNDIILKLTADNHVIVENNPKLDENINRDGNIQETIQTESSLNSSSHTQNPVYQPTLRIPHYKKRRSERETKLLENNTTVPASLTSEENNTTVTASLMSEENNTTVTASLASTESNTTVTASSASTESNSTVSASLASTESNTIVTASLASTKSNTIVMATLASTESNTTVTASLASKERNTTVTASLASTESNTTATAPLMSTESNTTVTASLASKDRNTTVTASLASTESNTTGTPSLVSRENNTTVTASLASKENNTTVMASLASKENNMPAMTSSASKENNMPVTTSLASKENDTTVMASLGSKENNTPVTTFASKENNTTVTLESKENNTIVTTPLAPQEKNTKVKASYAAMSTGAGSYSSLPVSFRSQNSTLTTNSIIASIAAQERITCSFTKCILNNAVTSASGLMQRQPVYSLLNNGIETTFENTRPVYALPKTCISMARMNTTTNCLLSIPSTTILCTTPVYTLAGTTIVTPVNYTTLPSSGHSIPYPSRSAANVIYDVDNQIMTNYTISNSATQEVRMNEESILIKYGLSSLDRDAEIMNTSIMFLTDILEVLKTMSVEHRKQLMDIVSKYLSVSKPTPILSTQLTLFSSSIPNILATPPKDTKELAVGNSTKTDKKPLNKSRVFKNRHRHQRRRGLNRTFLKLNSAALNEAKQGFRNKVINKVVSKEETDKKTNDVPELLLTAENCTAAPTTNNVSKTNNVKTASLRAVRMKAPAERRKLKIADEMPICKQSLSCKEVQVLPNTYNNDIRLNEILESKTFPDVQMYEVSSTQSNKNTVSDNKNTISDSKLSNHNIQPCKIMDQSFSINVIKSGDDLVVKEHSEELDNSNLQNSLLRKQSPQDIGIVKEVVKLNDISVIDSAKGPSLNESKKSDNVTIRNVEGKSLETYNLSAVENDDDSDDDISLAVIVKQKQQKQYNLKSFPKSNNKVICETNSKGKKGNKSTSRLCNQKNKYTDKRKTRKISTVRKTKINTLNERDVENTVKDTYTANLNMTPLNNEDAKHTMERGIGIQMKSNQVKKKEKINLTGALLVNVVNFQDKTDIERQKSEIESNKNNDNEFKKGSDFSCENNNLDLNGKEQNITSFHTPIVSSSCEVKVYESVESKTILNTNLKYITNIQEKLKGNENNTNINIENRKHVEENENLCIGTQNIGILLEACNQDQILQSTVPQQCAEFKHFDLKSCYSADKVVAVGPYETKLIRNNVPISNTLMAENPETNKSELTTFNREETETPLRRSGRGKSLFFYGNEQGVLMPSDGVLKPKAPFTKKQLIFSKLLLDEENNTKKLASIAVNPPILVENNVCQVVNPVNESFEEKSNLLKRKKSPVPNTKSKKNKSIDISQPMNSEDEVHKEFAAVNILAEKNITDIECVKPNPNLNREIDQRKDIAQPQNKFNKNDSSELPSENIKVDENKEIEPGSTIKRKIPLLPNNLDSVHMSEPKKLKLDNITDIGVTSNSVRQTAVDIRNRNYTNTTLPLAARRSRSKSVVVQSSGQMLYDPYDIDLEDMGDKTEPFRKQNKFWMCTTKDNVKKTIPDNILHATSTETIAAEKSKETISDSDESSKSDVPLMKYVEEKERKKLLLSENGNTKGIDEAENNGNDIKQSKKKYKKNKRTVTSIYNVQKEDKGAKEMSEEQLRSEQFMESFGFFSERKPRKSNLLATKKISETFQIIANESDDYWDRKGRTPKKSTRSENKRTVEENNEVTYIKPDDFSKVTIKWDKNLKLRAGSRYCHLCKKEFLRVDNLVRHLMSLQHARMLTASDSEPATPLPEEPNYLVIYKQHMDRLNILEYAMKKKNPKEKFTYPSLKEILAEVEKTVREQQLARTNLSRDQALFLDCCELLKDSNRGQIGNRSTSSTSQTCCASSYALANVSPKEYNPNSGISIHFHRYNKFIPNLFKKPIIHTSARLSGMEDFVLPAKYKKANADRYSQPSTSSKALSHSNFTKEDKLSIIIGEVTDEKYDSKSDGDMDSITAQNIMESEEVRNLENDLISGLKEAACKFQPLLSGAKISNNLSDNLADISCAQDSTCPQIRIEESRKKETASKVKNTQDSKEKKNLDICENIDIFEDKFDKIKRKCRSQAAAAKLAQIPVEPKVSYKSRKKSEKKKVKRNPKKCNPNTVPTKGALKGYDSIKVSISTSDINMSAIIPPATNSSKKKKKTSSKKKRDKKKSVVPRKLESHGSKAQSISKHIDVYEFLDNEEPEVFKLRPSTVMERFRNLNNKDTQFSNKVETKKVESSDSASDGDDFVYMSDDYVCSDEETENSLMSCELGNVKGSHEVRKSFSPLKRKDVMEKNAVMGKIFKHNAVRSEKKSKPKETTKPKANLDQLFDSLLEEKPKVTVPMKNSESRKISPTCPPQKKRVFSPIVLSKYDSKTSENNDISPKILRSPSPALSSYGEESKKISSFSSQMSPPKLLSQSSASPYIYQPSTSKNPEERKDYELPLKKNYDIISDKKEEQSPEKKIVDDSIPPSSEAFSFDTSVKTTKDKTLSRENEKTLGYGTAYDFKDYYDDNALSDDAGVARQRARRKCTVGKQNVLAETWSSESEPDGVPPRPNSAESVVLGAARKRKAKKREGHISGGKKGNKNVSVKKQDIESRVTSNNRNTGMSRGAAGSSRSSGSSSAYSPHFSLPGPSGIGPRLRPTTSYWADDNEEPEHVQQHGWIVGDSHKKLVTMLAHAKGRKRNNDDKQHCLE